MCACVCVRVHALPCVHADKTAEELLSDCCRHYLSADRSLVYYCLRVKDVRTMGGIGGASSSGGRTSGRWR